MLVKELAKRTMTLLAAVAALVLAPPGAAWAQAPGGSTASNGGNAGGNSGSGGPGTLGTEVPNDSAVAEGYIHSRTRVRGSSDRQLEEGVRQLQAETRRALDQVQNTKETKGVADGLAIADFNLLQSGQESGFDLGGGAQGGFAATGSMGADGSDLPSYGISGSKTAEAATPGTGAGSGSSEDKSSMDSSAQPDLQGFATRAGELAKEARNANRHQLASSLEVAQKALESAASSGGSSVKTGSAE